MRSPVRNGTVPSDDNATPSKAVTTSPRRRKEEQGEVGSTRVTSTPFAPFFRPRNARSAEDSSSCHSNPAVGKPVWTPLRSTSARKWATTGVGITYPTPSESPSFNDWNATPTHSPAALSTGPPLLPALMAASIWIDSS